MGSFGSNSEPLLGGCFSRGVWCVRGDFNSNLRPSERISVCFDSP